MSDWNRIQGTPATGGGSATLTVILTNPIASGNGIAGGVLLDTGLTLLSVTDENGGAYTIFEQHDDGVLYTAAFKSNGFITSGAQHMIFTASAIPGNYWTITDEFQPPTGATMFAVDTSVSQFNSAGLSWPSFTTTTPDELVYAAAMSSGTSQHGAGFNLGSGDTTARCSEWGIKASPGSVTMDLASQSNHFWGPAFAIKAGVGGGAASPSFGVLGMASSEW